MTAKEHNKLLSIFFFIQTGLTIFGGIMAAVIYGGMGAVMSASGRGDEQTIGGIFLIAAVAVSFFILIFSALYGFAGWKLYKEEKIGRTLGIVCSCIFLLGFPLGTALGIYGLWFLLGDDGKRFYSDNYQPGTFAPPPQSWQ